MSLGTGRGRPLEVRPLGETRVVITRRFDAPRELVFEAYTTPELLKRWLHGFEGWTMPVCEVDLRAGGGYRYVWRKAGEADMGLTGRIDAVAAPERIVAREVYDEDWTGGETVVVTEFEALEDGGTLVRTTVEYSSAASRDAALRTGMADGMEVGYARLEDLLTRRDL